METGIRDEIRSKLNLAHVSKPALVGMAMILAMVAVLAGFVLSGAATTSKLHVDVGRDQSSEVRSGSSGDASGSGAAASPSTVFVHVSGAVVKPGLYEIAEGSRVADAVNAAGGFSEDASSDSCNLARVVSDGEHIIIATQEQAASAVVGAASEAPQANPAPSSLININTASAGELESLPGIGEATAKKIVAERSANGPFNSVDDLMRVPGIGEKKLASLADMICV